MTILLPTWPESYLTILLQLMVLSWQMKEKSWHGGQPTGDTLHHWAGVVKKLLVIQPSSASAERVFILLNNAFNDQQDNAPEDYLEASVIIRYNNAKGL